MSKPSERHGSRVVVLVDKLNRNNRMKLVRTIDGNIWAEAQAVHSGVDTYTALRLGRMSDLLPRLAALVGPVEVELADKELGPHRLKLTRTPSGDIWAEFRHRNPSVDTFTGLRVGSVYELIPRLAELT